MTKKLLALLLVLAMLFTAAACSSAQNGSNNASPSGSQNNSSPTQDPQAALEQKRFAEFVDKQYKHSIEENYTTAHIYYKDPQAAGLDLNNIEISFGTAPDDESMEEDRAYYQTLMTELKTFNRSQLTPLQQDEYDSLEWEIGIVIQLSDIKFDYYAQLFTPPNSLESGLESIFTSWRIRNEQDIVDMITLIGTIAEYVETSIAYPKKQLEKKLLMTDFDQVIESCNDIISNGLDSYAISCIIDQVDEIEGISDAKREAYRSRLNAVFASSYLPSIERIRDEFEVMKDGWNNTGGYAALPDGSEYFQIMLNYKMGTIDKSVDDFWDEMGEFYDSIIGSFQALYDKNPNLVDNYYSGAFDSKFRDYSEILETVKQKMLTDHPEISDLRYNIQEADPQERLDEKSVAAYFIIPALDGDHTQQMRVNPSNSEISTLDTYMTVTHEGFPGHMYQFAYMIENIPSDYIVTLEVDSMIEGYAVYSQYHALEYLDNLNKVSRAVACYDSRLTYLAYSFADLEINYYGSDAEYIGSFFNQLGFAIDMDTAQAIYDLLRLCPVYYEPYSYGYEFIENLRADAEARLGSDFSALEFNKALLDAGPTPQSVVARHIDSYIRFKNLEKAVERK